MILTSKKIVRAESSNGEFHLLNIFAHELLGAESPTFKVSDLFNAINGVHDRCSGAYAVVALITGAGILAFRDPNGIRPLVIGEREGKNRKEYVIASENALFASLGFKTLRDVEPGEAVFIDKKGIFF